MEIISIKLKEKIILNDRHCLPDAMKINDIVFFKHTPVTAVEVE